MAYQVRLTFENFLSETTGIYPYGTTAFFTKVTETHNSLHLSRLTREAYALGRDGSYPFRSPIVLHATDGYAPSPEAFQQGIRIADGTSRLTALWLAGHEGEVAFEFGKYTTDKSQHNDELTHPYISINLDDFTDDEYDKMTTAKNILEGGLPLFVERGKEYAHVNRVWTDNNTSTMYIKFNRLFDDSFGVEYNQKLIKRLLKTFEYYRLPYFPASNITILNGLDTPPSEQKYLLQDTVK